jgi:hypothetical protein
MVGKKIYLGLFAFLRDLETRRGIAGGNFRGGEKIKLLKKEKAL